MRPRSVGLPIAAADMGRAYPEAVASSEGDVAGSDERQADPLREKLLDAASHVFASKGFFGTKIFDIVRAAGLSSGAIYGRFESKNELLTAAVVRATLQQARFARPEGERVADLLLRRLGSHRGKLSDGEALQLEAMIAARHEPEVAEAIHEARRLWRDSIEPLVQQGLEDGTVSPDLDVEAFLYFVQTMNLGILLQRGAGIDPPDAANWTTFVGRLLQGAAGPDRRTARRAGRQRR